MKADESKSINRQLSAPLLVGLLLIAWAILYATFPAQADGAITVRESLCTYIPLIGGVMLVIRAIWTLLSVGVKRAWAWLKRKRKPSRES